MPLTYTPPTPTLEDTLRESVDGIILNVGFGLLEASGIDNALDFLYEARASAYLSHDFTIGVDPEDIQWPDFAVGPEDCENLKEIACLHGEYIDYELLGTPGDSPANYFDWLWLTDRKQFFLAEAYLSGKWADYDEKKGAES